MGESAAVDWTQTKMKYNRLGRSGLKVSALSMGTWTFGNQVDEENTYEIMTVALRNGVNFFDTAETYGPDGASELFTGRVVQRWVAAGYCRRSDLVIATKLYWGRASSTAKGNPNCIGLSRKHIVEGCTASLARLHTDYVDLLFCHRADPQTPLEETVRAMNYLIDQGKIFYWGTSEWTAQEITRAHEIADRLGLVGPLMEQPQYNMLHRKRFEVEYQPLYAAYGLGTTIWSPLAMGFLTGKYEPGVIPEGSRLTQSFASHVLKKVEAGQTIGEIENIADVYDKVTKLKPIAAKLETTLAVLALAWCLKNPNVSTVITGASRPSQVVENMKALELVEKLTPAVLEEIEEALGNKPALTADYGRGQIRLD
eukprot:m.234443 g.234443  ORF g.234443 m.234443 type:complete len:369 (+) comp54305_c0_seq3:25-1131(+)